MIRSSFEGLILSFRLGRHSCPRDHGLLTYNRLPGALREKEEGYNEQFQIKEWICMYYT